MPKRKENDFEKLARLIKEDGEDTRLRIDHLQKRIDGLEKRMDSLEKKMELGFALVTRRLDNIIQLQLDEHAHRIKQLETAVFSK